MSGPSIKAGDRVRVMHDCSSDFGELRHDAPVLITSVTECTLGTRIRAVRCNNSLMEWIVDGDEVFEP